MTKEHRMMIHEYCTVIAETDNAIYYKEDGFGYAEINGASFSCPSEEEFWAMVEQFGEDDFRE